MKQRSKRLLSVLLTLVMLLGMIPGVAWANEPAHAHELDEQDSNASVVTFEPFSTSDSITATDNVYTIAPQNDKTLSFYLDADLNGRIVIPTSNQTSNATINLCLNGHKIDASETNGSAIYAGRGVTLNLCDCQASHGEEGEENYYMIRPDTKKAKIILKQEYDELGADVSKGSFQGGYITGGKSEASDGGGGVSSGTAFNQYGGTIIGNEAAYGGGVSSWGSFDQYGGAIIGNKATYGGGVSANGTMTLHAGVISNNTAAKNDSDEGGNGGGVYLGNHVSRMDMRGGTISDNNAESGGGLYIYNTFEQSGISAGEITGNKATSDGGGLWLQAWLDFTGERAGAIAIRNNTAGGNGGGLYYCQAMNMNIRGTEISNNSAKNGGGVYNTQYGFIFANENVAVSGNSATENGGGVYVDGGDEEEEEYEGPARVILRGGASVTNNTAGAAGGGVYVDGEISVGDTTATNAVVAHNTVKSADNNVYLASGKKILMAGREDLHYQLSEGTNIGITLADGAGVFTNRLTADQQSAYKNESNALTGYFFSDNPSYGVLPTEEDEADNQLKLGAVVPPHAHKLDGTASEGETVTFTKFSLTPNNKVYTINPGEGKTVSYYLDTDVEGRIEITGGTVNLCLNGHKIDANGTNNSAISVSESATLRLCDCHAHSGAEGDKHYYKINAETHLAEIIDKTAYDALDANAAKGSFVGGYITRGSTGGEGGGLDVTSGNVYLYDVTIIGNTADNGGGVSLPNSDWTFSFNNVNIIGNKAEKEGGGIYTYSPVTVSGGSISDNTAGTYGGGVEFRAYGKTLALTGVTMSRNKAGTYGGGVHMNEYNVTLAMTGGQITGNTAGTEGGGVDFANDGSFLKLSGAVKITDNKLSDNTASNAYLVHSTDEHPSVAFVIIGESGMASGSKVGITLGTSDGKGVFTKDIATDTARDAAKPNFFSDKPELSVLPATAEEGEHQLKLDVAPYAELKKLTLSNSTKTERNGSGDEATYPWVGDVLSAHATDAGDTEAKPVTYQWYRTDKNGANPVLIEGATEKTYTATAQDVDKYLKVVATQNEGADGTSLSTPITKQASIGSVALRPAPTPFQETHPTYPTSRDGQITKTSAPEDVDNFDNLYYSADNGNNWTKVQTDGKTAADLPAGTYLFTYRNSDGSLPESKIATVILTPTHDLLWLKLTSETEGKKANEVGATVKAVTNFGDSVPAGTTLSYQWYRVKENTDGTVTKTKLEGETNQTYTIVADDAGCKILVEVTWTYTGGSKSLSTPTPIILSETPTTYSVSGKVNRATDVSDTTGTACASATVELRQGNTVIATATTDNGGNYSFATTVPNGEYNIVVTKGGVTKTERVTVNGGNATRNVLLPYYDVSSLIVVQGNTPAVVIGSLDELAKTESAGISDGQSIEVKLTVEGKEDLTEKADSGLTTAQQAEKADQTAVKKKATETTGADTVVEFIDMSILKSTTANSNTTTEQIRDTRNNVLKIRIPYLTEGRYQFGIYRKHVDDSNHETTIAFQNNSTHGDGTFEVGKGYLDVYATKFSTYAIGYTTTPPNNNNNNNNNNNTTSGGSSDSSSDSYPVTVGQTVNGTVKADRSTASAGTRVTVTATPASGCKVDSVTVTDKNGRTVPVTRNSDGTYRFNMPESAVTVNVTFAKKFADPADTGVANWLNTDDHILYIRGYNEKGVSTVRADNNITRAEAAMMFYRLLKNQDVTVTKTFTDVSEGQWYAQPIGVLASLGIVGGYGDGTFLPNRTITRAEFAKIATRFATLTGGKAQFSDVPEGHWAGGFIATAADYGWIGGYEDGTYRPDGFMTRAAAAKIINYMLGRSADREYVLSNRDTLVKYTDLTDPNVWYYFELVEASVAHDFTVTDGVEKWK